MYINNDKLVCVLTPFTSVNVNLNTNFFIYQKLNEYYKNFYFVNIENIYNNKNIHHSINPKFSMFKFKNFKSQEELNNFFKKKEVIIFKAFSNSFENIRLMFYLKNLNCKLIMLSAAGNLQGNFLKNTTTFNQKINIIWKNIVIRKLYSFLAIFNLIPKIEIRFVSSKKVIRSLKKNILKRLLFHSKLLPTKKIISINSNDFEELKASKLKYKNTFIVHLDLDLTYRHKIDNRKIIKKKDLEKHYENLNFFLNFLQKKFNKKIKVAIHPMYNMKLIKKYLNKFEVFKFKTDELINKAFIVTDFGSSVIVKAILRKKKIITLKSKYLHYDNTIYSKGVGLFEHNIDNKVDYSKYELLKKLNLNTDNYKKFINTHHNLNKRNSHNIIIENINKLY